MLEPWVVWSLLLPSCFSQFIHMQMWDCPVCQQLLCLPWSTRMHPLHLGSLSLLLLPVWMNVTPWLSDFRTIWFSGSSGCFLFLNWLLSIFWLCEEVKSICLGLHLGWNLPFYPFLNIQFSGIKYIHIVLQTSALFISRSFSLPQKGTLYQLNDNSHSILPSASGNFYSIFCFYEFF